MPASAKLPARKHHCDRFAAEWDIMRLYPHAVLLKTLLLLLLLL